MKNKKVINFTDVIDMDISHTIKNTSTLNPPHPNARGVQDAQNAIGVITIPNSYEFVFT